MPTRKESKRRPAKKRLGRGLNSLIPVSAPVEIAPEPSPPPPAPEASTQNGEEHTADQVVHIELKSVATNPYQPRSSFAPEALKELADSIRTAGVMQPVIVRRGGSGFVLIAGERRCRAAEMAGLSVIPAIVREIDDQTAAEWALIENIQREDLNPIERAQAFQGLADTFGLTHAEIADRVSMTRSNVTNHLRLLELDDTTLDLVRAGTLSMGHARSLLGIANISTRTALAQRVVKEQWSVRELEKRIRELDKDPGTAPAASPSPGHAHMADLERALGEHLGTKVRITTGRKKGSGKVAIDFYSLEQFDGLLERLQFEYT